MPDYHLTTVDAFTTQRFAGNPCAVFTHAEGLSDAQMQAIAREMNLSETAFVTPSIRANFRVRFFTPMKEIPLAGHPTIATWFALAEEGRIALGEGRTRFHQELTAGVLPVDVERDATGNVCVTMTQAAPQFGVELDAKEYAAALGLAPDDILPGHPPQVVSTGTPQAMVPVRSLDVLHRLRPDLQRLKALEERDAFFSTHVFTLETFDPAHRAHSRHIGAGAGIPEDPVTGSASGAMAAYLWKHGLLREPHYRVEQGDFMGRPGRVDIEVDADGADPRTVRIAGRAVTVLRGTITV